MERLIECGTCGYPLLPEEREGLVEIDGKMCKPRKPLTEQEIDNCWYESGGLSLKFARSIERAHGIGEKE